MIPPFANSSAARHRTKVLQAAVVLLGIIPTFAVAAPTARMVASRVSGPAPLAVFFDATGTTDSDSSVDPFLELGYRFTFGDTAAGTWPYSGRSKNEQIGAPLAAHVFERAGTYTVQVAARDASGATSTASVVITVEAADTFYAGTKTVCLSRTTDFAGCPSGAQQIANASSYPAFQSGYRYLLHRGQDFTSLGGIGFGSGGNGLNDSQLGAFGSGSKPVVGNVNIVSGSSSSTWHRRVVVMDLDAANLSQDTGGYDLLMLRNTINRGGMVQIASAFDYYASRSTTGIPNPENVFLVENQVDRNYTEQDSGGPMGVSGNALRLAILGNIVDRTVEHNIRLWQASKAIIAHNNLPGRSSGSIRHALKLHAGGVAPIATGLLPTGQNNQQRTSMVTVADNLLGSDQANINWITAISPQNDNNAEGLEYVVVEDNTFRFGTNHVLDIAWTGRNLLERGNSNATSGRVSTGRGHVGPLTSEWLGPYYTGQSSMKLRFSASDDILPRPPNPLNID